MRIAAELFTILGGGLTLAGFVINRFFKQRRQSNLDHVKELARENEEIDEYLNKFRGGS